MQTFRSDVEQAYRMCIFRVMIDKWSQGVDESIRSRNRAIVEDAYMRCPPHRMWVYIKVARVLLGPGPTSGQSSRGADELDSFWAGGIEDGIANGMFKQIMTRFLIQSFPSLFLIHSLHDPDLIRY